MIKNFKDTVVLSLITVGILILLGCQSLLAITWIALEGKSSSR
jgi:hypothetical protein